MDKLNTLKSVLKTTSKDPTGIAAKVNNIEGKLRMPMRTVSFDKPVHASKVSIVEGCEGHDTPVGSTSVGASSFASVFSNSQGKKSVKISEMHNIEAVEGAKVVIPMEAVEEVSSRFQNTLYGFFIGEVFSISHFQPSSPWEPYDPEKTPSQCRYPVSWYSTIHQIFS
ncbi:hypothetical protein Tco_0546602 [Tanacetum coccineum]